MNLALGTAAIGRPHYINLKDNPSPKPFNKSNFIKQGEAVLSKAYKKGIRHFDTAPGYGIAESILLNWINKNQIKDVTVSSKWGYTYTANFNPNASVHEVKEHSLEKLKEQWAFTKKFIPYLNVYQIHSATIDTGVLENDAVLKMLFDIKFNYGIEIGLSSSGINQKSVVERAMKIKYNGKPLFTVFQVTYNVLEQSLKEIINSSKDFKFIIKEALANGRVIPNSDFNHYNALYNTLESIGEKHKVGPDAVAIKYCIQSVNAYKVLSGAYNEKQITDNLKALNFELTSKELTELDDFSSNNKKYWEERSNLTWQ